MDPIENIKKYSDEYLIEIIDKAKDWAMLHGLSMRTNDGSTDRVQFVPFTLLPSIFPRSEYNKIYSLQYVINELIHRIAHDRTFLREVFKEIVKTDDFARRLFEIYEKADSAQTVALGLLRSDYMLDQHEDNCKQVEVNTVASGQGWLATVCTQLHRYIFDELEAKSYDENLAVNVPIDGLCKAIVDAWKIYDEPRAVVVFIVEDYEQHIADQRYHEYRLRQFEPRIRVFRRTLRHIFKFGKLEGNDRRLVVDNNEVALVYFRSGYSPNQYPTEEQWDARFMIEQSKAIKCPTIGYFLANMKKIQEVLVKPGCVERFVKGEDCHRLRQVFTGFYPLDFSEAGESAIKMAITNPSNYVLKPQREGGGNNFFGEAIRTKLESIKESDERNNWTLMDKISAKVHRNYLIRPNYSDANQLVDVTSEIGIFGTILGSDVKIISNTVVGHMLRTKFAEADEVGVSSGFGACDSPYFS